MASLIEMSLDDIIKKKKKENPRKPIKKPVNQPPNQNKQRNANQAKKVSPLKNKLPITDARNKIISKKRTQITDARDKLAEMAKKQDARFRLEKMRLERMARIQGPMPTRPVGMGPGRGNFFQNLQPKEPVFVDPSRQVMYQPVTGGNGRNMPRRQINTKRYAEPRQVSTRQHGLSRQHERSVPQPKPIVRTVENDIEMIDDPMGDDEYIPKLTSLNRKASLQLKIIAHNNDARSGSGRSHHRTAITEHEKSPPRPPSILKKRPMAALRSEQIAQKPEKPTLEYRIIVSNLRNTVTGGDIEELFGDVGGMVESRLVRPGTAEVIYKTQEDAQKAVELYHNRQLDGQPMNCLLVTPRTPTAAMQRNSSKPALYSTNSNVEPDISTFHKVLFSNL